VRSARKYVSGERLPSAEIHEAIVALVSFAAPLDSDGPAAGALSQLAAFWSQADFYRWMKGAPIKPQFTISWHLLKWQIEKRRHDFYRSGVINVTFPMALDGEFCELIRYKEVKPGYRFRIGEGRAIVLLNGEACFAQRVDREASSRFRVGSTPVEAFNGTLVHRDHDGLSILYVECTNAP
jgi:hypothetical protein